MEYNILQVSDRQELRNWLSENCTLEKSCWICVSMKPSPGVIYYLDAVEECLCFGWIDTTRKKLPDGRLIQRLTPRTKNSRWSELNKERVRRLEKLGLMTDEGRKRLPDMSLDFVIDEQILEALQSDEEAYSNFLKFPDLYKRVRINTIQIKKNQPQLFQSRLEKFIENTKLNKVYGNWNDNGRLLDY